MAKKIKTNNSNINFGGAPTVTSMFALSKENKEKAKRKWDQSYESNPIINNGITSPEYKDQIVKRRDRVLNYQGQRGKNAALQDQLFNIGVFGNMAYEKAVDGIIGKNTRAALQRAAELGYSVDEAGKLVKTNTQAQIIANSNNKNISIKPISLEIAKDLYKNGDGTANAIAAAIYHVLIPDGIPMLHSQKVKNQVAAIIGYGDADKKIDLETSKKSIGYEDAGLLSDQNLNPNKQAAYNNAFGKVLGGAKYTNNTDNSIDIDDTYQFIVHRDFNKMKANGEPSATNTNIDELRKVPLRYRNLAAITDLFSTLRNPNFKQ